MQVKLLLTLLLIIILSLIISSGCGGGSGTNQPSSLVTPTPNCSDTGSGDTAYITFNVKWPEQGNNGSMTLSKNGATIPKNTQIIDIYILDYTGDPNNIWSKVVAAGNIHRGQDNLIIPVKIIGQPTPGVPNQGTTGPPPAIKVKIYAEAFNSFDPNNPTSRPKKQLAHTDPNRSPDDLKVGNQNISLKLIQVTALNTTVTKTTTARSIIASDTGSSNEYDINANLQLMYGTPFPVSTVIPDPSGEVSEPLEGQTVNFKIIQGSGQLDAIQAQTDPNGDCKVHFTRTSAYNVIEASYQYDPDDPNTIVTSQCTIGDNYELTVDPNNVILNLPPLYTRNTNMISNDTPTPGSGGSNSVNITAKLNIVYPTPAPNSTSTPKPPKPAEGKLIKFEIIEGNDGGTYLSLAGETGPIVSGFTLADGTSTATLTTSTAGHKTIKAFFQPDSTDPNSIYSDYCYVTVMAPPLFTPTPTETPEPTQTPTVTPTPTLPNLPISYPSFIEGTWQEQYGLYQKPAGKIYTVTLTDTPVYIPYCTEQYLGMKIIITGENGQIEEGFAVSTGYADGTIGWKEVDGSTSYGTLYKDPGFSHYGNGGYPGILWGGWYDVKHKPWVRSSKIE